MTDLIKREDVIDRIEICCDGLCGVFCDYDGAMKFQKLIENIPSVEQDRPIGHWEKITDCGKVLSYQCACGCTYKHKFNYCPNCGAKMENAE